VSDLPSESEELRLEMETHLSMLEEDARKSGASSSDATRDAEKRFGSAADHFRESLAEWTHKQRSLRNTLIAIALGAVVISAVGIVVNVRLLNDLRTTVSGWVERSSKSVPELGKFRYEGVMVEVTWESAVGVVRSDMPMMVADWRVLTAPVSSQCRGREFAMIEFEVTDAIEPYFLGVPVGTKLTCTPKALIAIDWHSAQPPTSFSDWLRQAGGAIRLIRCVECP